MLRNPIHVTWLKADETKIKIDVSNHWTVQTVEQAIADLPNPFDSWRTLEEHCRRSYDHLTFANEFMRLVGFPYVRSIAEGICILLNVLDKLSTGIDEGGKRMLEGETLYQTYFIGGDPYFTDESIPNKRDYKAKLTFPHPTDDKKTLFIPWHGKVNSPTNFPPVRIHFTWPVTSKGELYVAYVGSKLTMR